MAVAISGHRRERYHNHRGQRPRRRQTGSISVTTASRRHPSRPYQFMSLARKRLAAGGSRRHRLGITKRDRHLRRQRDQHDASNLRDYRLRRHHPRLMTQTPTTISLGAAEAAAWTVLRCRKPHPKIPGWVCNGLLARVDTSSFVKGSVVSICPRCYEETVLE